MGATGTLIRYDQLVPIKAIQILNTPAGTISSTNVQAAIDELNSEKESSLGNPSVTGYVLSSTTGGSRSWIAPSGGADGNNYPTSLGFSGGTLSLGRSGLSDLTTSLDGRYLTSYNETDPNISTWARASVKPSYSYSEIGSPPTALSSFTNDLGNYGSFVTGTPWTSMGYLTSQTSHADVVVDGDFTSQGIILRGATSGTYSILTNNSSNWDDAYSKMGKVNIGGSYLVLSSGEFFDNTFGTGVMIKDANPTSGSTKPVQSGGVYTALSGKAALAGSASQAFSASEFDLPNGWVVNDHDGIFRFYYSGQDRAYIDGSGNMALDGSITSIEGYRGSSDIRLKKNIKPIERNVSAINLCQFEMKSDSTKRIHYGAIAQEVEKIAPELVYEDGNGMKSVAYIELLVLKVAQLEKEVKSNKQIPVIPSWIWACLFSLITLNVILIINNLRK